MCAMHSMHVSMEQQAHCCDDKTAMKPFFSRGSRPSISADVACSLYGIPDNPSESKFSSTMIPQMIVVADLTRIPPPPGISYANVHNYYGPYAYCSLDKGVACAQHIQLLTHTCVCAWYGCTLTSTHISKSMQTQESLGNMKIAGPHPCCHKQ